MAAQAIWHSNAALWGNPSKRRWSIED